MNPGQLLVQPEYMYLDVEKKKLYFCCMPGKAGDVREDFRVLTEYILPKIDHEDGDAVILGYGVYRRALEDTFHLECIKEEIYKGRDNREKSFSGNEDSFQKNRGGEKRIPESCKEKEIDKEKGQFREQYENQSGDYPWEIPLKTVTEKTGKNPRFPLGKKSFFLYWEHLFLL